MEINYWQGKAGELCVRGSVVCFLTDFFPFYCRFICRDLESELRRFLLSSHSVQKSLCHVHLSIEN
jgi:hypothetical protein